jgi:hypothetical protein
LLGVNPNNINHELCHYTDDVTRLLGVNPNNNNIVNLNAIPRAKMI